jgi:hypothetical protein
MTTSAPSRQFPPEYYESGELPPYAQVVRSYSSTGVVPAHEAIIARIKARQEQSVKKYNPNHDPETGEFSSGDGGDGAGGSGANGNTPAAPDGPLLFHGTTQEAIDSIAQNGLVPASGGGATAEHVGSNVIMGPGGQPTAVYFAASPRQAARFANMAAKATGGTPVVVPVHLSSAQAGKLTWDTLGAGDHNVKLGATIPPENIGKPAVGMDAINKMTKSFGDRFKQFNETSEQRSGSLESPQHTFVPQHTSAVRDLMGKAAAGMPTDEQQVIFATFVVNDKAKKYNPNHDDQGRFADGGGGGAKESSHPTHPLPDTPGSQAVYDMPDAETVTVARQADGSYYGDAGEFDFQRSSADAMRSYLQSKQAKHVGWEHKKMDKAGARHSSGDRGMIQKIHDHAVGLGAECPGMAKSDDKGETVEFAKRHDMSVLKVDDELGLVFGWAIVSKDGGEDYFDVQGDHIPEHSMLKASTDFMLSDRIGKEMHDGEARGTIVFAWPLTEDIAKAMGLTTDRTGLMIAWKPHDVATLDKFKSGEYSGFSIGGHRNKDEEVD